MTDRKYSPPSVLALVLSFSVFYAAVETLLFANRNIFGPSGVGNDFVLLLITFLNIAPAGIFAFSVVSILPSRFCSEYNEENVMKYAPLKSRLRVAVLYATYNDFLHDYATYNSEQAEKLNAPFFILDDSTSPAKKRAVDRFASKAGCTVVRRNSRKGFKAGAINHWILLHGRDFDYIFILDSDSQASAASISRCAELARRDPNLGLVQTKTLTMTSNPSRMTKSNVTIQHAYMAVVQNAMKKMGSSPYYGHNALVKIEALNEVGGFIEESNEDYKTLARLHDAGYGSLYASSAETWEEIPPDYFSARKRSLRWARDAVGQLGLLRFRVPFAMVIYLIYGWQTYMGNVALLALFFLFATRSPTIQSSTVGSLAWLAGSITMAVIVLWPLMSLRIKDPELNVRSILSAVGWGTFYSAPMAAPVSLQIVKTSLVKIAEEAKGALGFGTRSVEEFVVTPKTRSDVTSLRAVIGHLKVELVLGSAPLVVAILTGSYWFVLFSMVQSVSLFFLPLSIVSDARDESFFKIERHVPVSAKEYARGFNKIPPEALPQHAYLMSR